MFSLLGGLLSWWSARQQSRAEMFNTVLKFVLDNIKWVAISAVIIIGYVWIHGLMVERDEAVNALAEYKAEAKAELDAQKQLVMLLQAQGQAEVEDIKQQHLADLNAITKGKIKNEKDANNYRNQLANRLREQHQEHSSRMPKDDTNKSASADSDTTAIGLHDESAEYYKQALIGAETYIDTLNKAGAVCASDYNTCKSYVDSQQAIIGVSE
jgi:hypothetical protein